MFHLDRSLPLSNTILPNGRGIPRENVRVKIREITETDLNALEKAQAHARLKLKKVLDRAGHDGKHESLKLASESRFFCFFS